MVLVQPSQDNPGHDYGGLGLRLSKGKKVRGHEPWHFNSVRCVTSVCRADAVILSEGVGTGGHWRSQIEFATASEAPEALGNWGLGRKLCDRLTNQSCCGSSLQIGAFFTAALLWRHIGALAADCCMVL